MKLCLWGKKNDNFSFLVKLMSKLVYLENVVFDNVFFFKSLNVGITNYGFEFDSIAVV